MTDMDAEALKQAIERDRPRPYDLDNADEILRLYRECRGYLRTCHNKHGTDWEGRKFAIDALDALVVKTNLLRRLGAKQRRARIAGHRGEQS